MFWLLLAMVSVLVELCGWLLIPICVVCVALKEGVVRVVRTFGAKLNAFRFPPQIAHKLQGFVDYN